MEEILDLVDPSDSVIGSRPRSTIYKQKLSNFRVINGFLKNSKGELWIPRRTAHKELFPLHLDVSVGGHVQSGESYEEAFIRELQEELNMNASELSYREIGYFMPHVHNISAFMKVYEIRTEKTPLYNPDDFTEAQWLTPEALIENISRGEKAKGDLPKLMRLVYNL